MGELSTIQLIFIGVGVVNRGLQEVRRDISSVGRKRREMRKSRLF